MQCSEFLFLISLFRPPLKSWTRLHCLHLQHQLLLSRRHLWSPQPVGPRGPSITTLRRTPSPTSVPLTSSWTCPRSPHAHRPTLTVPSSLSPVPPPPASPPSPRSSSSRRRCLLEACRSRRLPRPLLDSRRHCSRCRAPRLLRGFSRWCTPRLLPPCRQNPEAEARRLQRLRLLCRLK